MEQPVLNGPQDAHASVFPVVHLEDTRLEGAQCVVAMDLSLTSPAITVRVAGVSTDHFTTHWWTQRKREEATPVLSDVSPHQRFVRHPLLVAKGDSTAMVRIGKIRDALIEILHGLHPTTTKVHIEGYSYSSGGANSHHLSELGGVIRMTLADRGFTWREIPPRSVKKSFTNKGNASKAEMVGFYLQKGYKLPAIEVKRPEDHPNEDIVDSIAISLA